MSEYKKLMGYNGKPKKKEVVKKHVPTVTENLEKEFGSLSEGPAYEYANYVKQIEKTENLQAKAVNKFVKVLEKKGFKKEARNVAYTYMTSMRKFNDYLQELVDKLL